MIIVTGLRSGTSWTMQTLKMLGCPVVGFKFHDDFSHRELNPYGYYNLPMVETIFGLKTHYKGCAVKLGGAELYQTNPNFIKHIIICERNRDDTINSIQKLLEADFNIAQIKPSTENARISYEINKSYQEQAVKEFGKPYTRIQFEDMKNKYNEVCNKLKELLWQWEVLLQQ